MFWPRRAVATPNMPSPTTRRPPATIVIVAVPSEPAEGSPPGVQHGDDIRGWLHVEDHAAPPETVVEQGAPGETYDIGGMAERTDLDVVQTLRASSTSLQAHSIPVSHAAR